MQLTGFDIMEEGTTDDYKSLYDIFDGLAQVWDNLSETQQSRVSEILGGTRQLQVISSIINNWDDAASAYAEAMDSAGVATEAQDTYMTSLNAKIDQFNASVQELYYDFLSSDFASGIVDFGSNIIQVFDNIVDSIGSVTSAIMALGAGSIVKSLIQAFFGTNAKTSFSQAFAGTSFGSLISNVSAELTSLSSAAASTGGVFQSLWGIISNHPLGTILTAIAAVAGIFTLLSNNAKQSKQEMIEAGEEAQSTINEVYNDYQSKARKVNTERYGELVTGVNPETNENVSLASDEYQEYLSLCNDIADIYPELVTGYTEQGDAILNLGNNAETATAQLEAMLRVDEMAANFEIADNLEAAFLGAYTQAQDLQEEIDDLTKSVSEYDDELLALGIAANDVSSENMIAFQLQKIADGERDVLKLNGDWEDYYEITDALQYALESVADLTYGVDYVGESIYDDEGNVTQAFTFYGDAAEKLAENMDEIGGALNISFMEQANEAGEARLEDLNRIATLEKEYAQTWDDLVPSIISSMATNPNYYELTDDIQGGIGDAISNISFSDLPSDVLEGDKSLEEYVKEEFLYPIADAFNDVTNSDVAKAAQDAYGELFSLDTSELTNREYITQMKENLAVIQDYFREFYGDNWEQEYLDFTLRFGFNVVVGVDEDTGEDIVVGAGNQIRNQIDKAYKEEYGEIISYDLIADLTEDQMEAMAEIIANGDIFSNAYKKVVEDAQSAIDSSSLTFSGLLFDSEGEQSEFSQSIDDFQSYISDINSALGSIRDEESEVNLMDLKQQFEGLSGGVEDLDQNLSQLALDELRDFSQEWKEATSELSGDEAQQAIDSFMSTIAEVDFSGLDYSDFMLQALTNAYANIDDTQWRLQDKVVEMIDSTMARYSDEMSEEEIMEILMKLTLVPDFTSWTFDELYDYFDQMREEEVEIEVDVRTEQLDNLSNQFDLIEYQADKIQREMDRNDTINRKNGEQMYRDLINNGNLQIQNLEKQRALWAEMAAEAEPLSEDYMEALSEIESINSEIDSVVASQYEWNAAADALSYEAGEALSAYNEANSSRNAGDNYKDMKSAFEAAEELYEEGLVGTDEFQAAAAMLSPNGMTDWVNWEQNYAKATRYFTDDNSGLINFLEDLSQKTNDAGEALANFDEATGTWTYNIDDIADSADQLGISMEAFQAIMGRTQDYGFTNNWFATVEDGVNRLGDLYTDLAEAEIKLQDLEKKRSEGSTSVTDEVIQAQKDEIDSIKLAIVDSTDLLSKTTDQFEEQTAAQYQALTTMLDKSMDIADERIRNTYLQNVKDWAEQNGLDVGDLFTVNKEGQIDGLVDETFEQLKEDYGKGEYELDFDVSVKTEAQELGESLSDTFEEVIEGTGKSTKDMFDEFVQTFEETDLEGALSQIIWGNGEYEEGVEDVERAIDHITSSLGLAQSDAAALGQLLAAYAQTGDLEKAIELVADTSQYEEEVNYALAEPEEQEVEVEVTEPEELTRQEMTGLRLGVETGEAEGKVEQLHSEIEDMFNENVEQTVETTIETNKDIGSINDLLALDEEDLAIKCGVEMDSAELSAIEDYIGWEEPELPVTIRMEQTQFDALLESQEQNEIQITVDTDEATGEIQTLQGEIDDLISNSSTPITIEVDVSAASGALSGLQQQISEIMSGNALTVDGNGGFATEELTSYYSIPITGEIQSFEISADIETVPIDGELTTIAVDAEVQTVDVNGEMKEISVSAETPPVPLSGNLQDISVDAEVQTIPLTGEISSIDVTADTPSVPIEATISSVDQEAISSLSDRSVTVTSSTSGTEDVNALTAAIDSLYDRTVQETAKVSGTSEVQSLKSAIDSLYSKTVDVRATVAGEADVRSLANAIANVQSKTVTVTSITQNITQSSDYGILATGTAYSEGSLAKGWKEFKKVGGSYIKGAYAGGSWRDWSLHSDEDAIVNELGQESVVRDGHWMLLPGGAHVESLKRGDIVFSADQTKELLKYGKVTSGGGHGYVAHATGTAYNMMNAHANRGQFAPTVASTSSSSSTSSGNTTVIYNNSGNTTNNYGTSSGGTTSNAAEAAQTFEDWVGTLFDWVEVRLERLTDQISNYIQKAENAINTRYYNQADRSYRSAINKSLTQVGREDQAYLKYMEEVDAILQKAADSGIIDANAIGIIKTQMEKGELKIEEYSEEMQKVISATQEYYDKAMEASYAIEQLNADIISYTQSLKSLRDTQRDSKISNYEDYAVAGSTYTSTSGTYHLRYESQLRLESRNMSKENTAYSKESTQMKNDMKKYQSKAKSQVESAYSEASGKYKKALKRAQKAINKQEAVSNSDMKVIGENSNTVYAYLLAYNESLNNLEEARLEEAVVYASNSASIMENTAEKYNKLDENSQNKIDLNEMKASNSNVAKTANKYLDRAAKEYDTILSNDQAEVDEYTTEYKSNRKKIRNKKGTTAKLDKASASKQKKVQKAVDNAKKNAEKGIAIGAGTMSNLEKYYSEGYVTQSFYQSCVDYNNAIEHKREAEAQLEIDKQTAQEEQRAYGQQEFENVQNEYENKTRQNQSKTANIEAQQNYQTTRGIIMNEQNYRDLISQSQKDVKIYNDEIKALNDQIQHNIDSGYWTTTDQEYIDAMLAIEELETEVINCETAQEEWNNAIINLPFEEVERMINSLTTVQSLLESISSLTTAQRQDLTLSNYTDQIDNYYKQLEQWEADLAEAQKDYQKALADPDGVYGGKTVQTWEDEINQYQTEINNCEIAIENMKDSLRDDIIWRQFDRAHSRAKELLDVLEGISGLLDESMWFTYEGQITEFGIAEVSSLTKQISAAQTDVQNYMNDIDTLQKLYDMNLAGIDIDEKALSELGELSDKYYDILEYGFYSDEEYTEKMAELQEQLLDAANSVQDLTNDIINMYKTAAQYELDAIFDVIDAEKDALDAKKSYVIMAPLL